jgi:hypothetical protein
VVAPTPVLHEGEGLVVCARGFCAAITTGNIVFFAPSVDRAMDDAV